MFLKNLILFIFLTLLLASCGHGQQVRHFSLKRAPASDEESTQNLQKVLEKTYRASSVDHINHFIHFYNRLKSLEIGKTVQVSKKVKYVLTKNKKMDKKLSSLFLNLPSVDYSLAKINLQKDEALKKDLILRVQSGYYYVDVLNYLLGRSLWTIYKELNHVHHDKNINDFFGTKEELVDFEQFYSFVKISLKDAPKNVYINGFNKKTLEYLAKVYDEKGKHYTKEFKHYFSGKDQLPLTLIPDSYMRVFANSSYLNKEKWFAKRDLYYRDSHLFRRVSILKASHGTDKFVLTFFKKISPYLSSQRVYSKFTKKRVRTVGSKSLKYDFQRHNDDVFYGDRVLASFHHIKKDVLYEKSYLTTAFLNPASALLGQGKHRGHGSLLVAKKSSVKDIIFPNLSETLPDEYTRNESFKKRYEDRALVVGGFDPDFISYVQVFSEKGKVVSTFVRNPQIPSQIVKISGDYIEFSKIKKENIIKEYNLVDG